MVFCLARQPRSRCLYGAAAWRTFRAATVIGGNQSMQSRCRASVVAVVAARGRTLGFAVVAAASVAGAPVIDAVHADPGSTPPSGSVKKTWGIRIRLRHRGRRGGQCRRHRSDPRSVCGIAGQGTFRRVRLRLRDRRHAAVELPFRNGPGTDIPSELPSTRPATSPSPQYRGSLTQPNKGEFLDAFVVSSRPTVPCARGDSRAPGSGSSRGVAIDEAGNVVVVGRTMGPLAGRIRGSRRCFRHRLYSRRRGALAPPVRNDGR